MGYDGHIVSLPQASDCTRARMNGRPSDDLREGLQRDASQTAAVVLPASLGAMCSFINFADFHLSAPKYATVHRAQRTSCSGNSDTLKPPQNKNALTLTP